MLKETLDNGLNLMYVERDSKTVCIMVNVGVGSNDETEDVAGISHFIEHMLFEGTKKRANSYLISNEIEKLGGEFNAATSNERTFYYVKVPAKHFSVAADVMSDIISDPLFSKEHIEKEKSIVIDEIKLVNDQPRFYQWVKFQKSLYDKHPAKNPIYGSIESIHSMDQEKVLDYYKEHYRAGNMSVAIVGKADIAEAKKLFGAINSGSVKKQVYSEPAIRESRTVSEKKDTIQAYAIIGFQTASRDDEDSYVLDVIRAVLGRGQSGKIFNEIRNKRGLAYDVGVLHNPSTDFGYMAFYVNTNKKNVEKAKSIVIDEIGKLKDISAKDLEEAKTYLEGEYLMQAEDNQKMSDMLCWWDQISDYERAFDYVERIMVVSAADVKRVVEKYFDNYVMSVIE